MSQIGIYRGEGTSGPSGEIITNVLSSLHNVSSFTEDEIDTLSAYDLIIFPGGASHKEAMALQQEGIERVREYVKNGGAYLGVCAGMGLASAGYEWSLHLVPIKKAVEGEWKRGEGMVTLELTPKGQEVFPEHETLFTCRYHNGMIVAPSHKQEDYEVLAYYRSEISDNGTTRGAMIDTPAIVLKDRVLLISPHPEQTPGLEDVIPKAVDYLLNFQR